MSTDADGQHPVVLGMVAACLIDPLCVAVVFGGPAAIGTSSVCAQDPAACEDAGRGIGESVSEMTAAVGAGAAAAAQAVAGSVAGCSRENPRLNPDDCTLKYDVAKDACNLRHDAGTGGLDWCLTKAHLAFLACRVKNKLSGW
ncbi:MAG: hypothetical protein IT565_14375 [Rhodospirillales bacterium]|nr:hypothetical protein [Rhodospirillales bacterium]